MERPPSVDFSNPTEPGHDVALVIGGQKVYVSKSVLSLHSPYFKSLFYGGFVEKDKKEIELKDVDREQFIEMLRVIYPSNKKITEDLAEYLLKLGDRFEINCVRERAEKCLIDSEHVSFMEKFRIAHENNLFGLRGMCIFSFSTAQDFVNIYNAPLFNSLSRETKIDLFKGVIPILQRQLMVDPVERSVQATGEIERQVPVGVITFDVNNFSALDFLGRFSEEVELKGVQWRCNVYMGNGKEIYATLDCMANKSTPWSIRVDAEFAILHPASTKSVNLKKSEFLCLTCDFVAQMLIKGDELDKFKEMIKDDKITVEIRFWIADVKGIMSVPRIDFTDPKEPGHDVALVIGGQRLYASKKYLSLHSPLFKELFYVKCVDNDTIEFPLVEKGANPTEDVDREEFIDMLHVIYPSNKKITEDRAEYLLKLGDRFEIDCVMERAEKCLIDTKEVSDVEKLRLADKYRLSGLQEKCFSALKTTADFKAVKDSPIYKGLSDRFARLLLERHLSIVT